MKFLFLCHSLRTGGIETYILRFSQWMNRNSPNHELHLLCKSGEFGSYSSEFQQSKVILHPFPMGFFNPVCYLRFYYFLKWQNYNAICDFGGDFGALTIICAFIAKMPKKIAFYRNAKNPYVNTKAKHLYQSLLNKIVCALSTNILSNSNEAFNFYFKNYNYLIDSRFQVIRNGIPESPIISNHEKILIKRNLDILPNQKIVLHVGSDRWEKNHRLMLKIANSAQLKKINACFYFVGPGVERSHRKESMEMGLRNVRFLGERRDVYELLQAADLFIFPSLSEGQPNALLEAIINGVPFIASNISSIKECLPSTWGERWLFAPDDFEQGVTLLQQHLNNDFRQDKEFRDLVAWFKITYNEDKQFGRFLDVLTCGQNTENR